MTDAHHEDPRREAERRELEEAARTMRSIKDVVASHLADQVDQIAQLIAASADPALPPAEPLEQAVTRSISRSSPGGPLSFEVGRMRHAVDAALKPLAGSGGDAEDARARVRAGFCAIVLGLRGGADFAAADVSEGLLERLRILAEGGSLPEPRQSAMVGTMVRDWRAMTERQLWQTMALATVALPAPMSSRAVHLAWMGLIGEISPDNVMFTWNSPEDQRRVVRDLIASAGDEHDISRIYDKATSLEYQGKPLPRAVMAECVQLALGNLGRIIYTSTEQLEVLRTPQPEPTTKGLSPAQKQAVIAAYNRAKALRAAGEALYRSAGDRLPDPQRDARIAANRYALEVYWAEYLATTRSKISAPADGGESALRRFDALLENESFGRLLAQWSAKAREPVPELATLADLAHRIGVESERLATALKELGEGGGVSDGAFEAGLQYGIDGFCNEVALEASDLIIGRVVPTAPLDGLRFRVSETRSAPAELATARSVNGPKTTAALRRGVLSVEKAAGVPYEGIAGSEWFGALRKAVEELPKALTPGTATTIVTGVTRLGDALAVAEGEMTKRFAKLPDVIATYRTCVDVFVLASWERIADRLASADRDVLESGVLDLAVALRKRVRTPDPLSPLAKGWSQEKSRLLDQLDTVDKRSADRAKKVFTDGFGTTLAEWERQVDAWDPTRRESLAQATESVLRVLRAYRAGLEETLQPSARVGFDLLLDRVSFTVDWHLAMIEGREPPIL